jgi:hypothetical protein
MTSVFWGACLGGKNVTFSIALSTERILDQFSEVITDRGGRVSDTFNDGRRLFTRSILNLAEDVKPRDGLRGGVALKATPGEVCVHPYVFRQVCKNGAIMPQIIGTERLSRLDWRDCGEALDMIREAVSECCDPEVFRRSVEAMQATIEVEADLALTMLPGLARFGMHNQIIGQILGRFFNDDDRSTFSLMQAVTATARDTFDPELRWDLEELGGGIAAQIAAQPPGGCANHWLNAADRALAGVR